MKKKELITKLSCLRKSKTKCLFIGGNSDAKRMAEEGCIEVATETT